MDEQTTPSVLYVYEDGAVSGAAKYVRLDSVIYPDGRTVYYNYPASGVGGVLSRLDNIAADANGTVQYAQYAYLGSATIVRVAHPSVTNGLTLSYGTSSNHYSSLDRFGRIEDQIWTNGAGSTTLDSYTYTYDRNSNRTARANNLDEDFDEAYEYDGLDRLVDFERGVAAATQSWDLDALGNWAGTTIDGDDQARTHNAANETDAISGDLDWIDPLYDTAGNMTSGPKAGDEDTRLHYVYDAWNHMTAAYADNSGQQGAEIATYEYDALGRRIQKTAGGHTLDYYWTEGYQNVETRQDGDADPIEQYVYDIRYIDAPILRDAVVDTSFSGDGKATLDLGAQYGGLADMLLLSDGRILAAGTYGGDFALVCFNADGSLDTTFGDSDGNGGHTGWTVTNMGTDQAHAYGLGVLSDGRIIVGGYSAAGDDDVALARYSAAGVLDSTFGSSGILLLDLYDSDMAVDVLVNDDSIYLCGITSAASVWNGYVARLDDDGALDTGFSGDGIALIDWFNQAWIEEIALDDEGRIVAIGGCVDSTSEVLLVRLATSGALDTTFGDSDGQGGRTGWTSLELGGDGSATDLALQADGHIVIGGGLSGDFIVLRYTEDGVLDSTFDGESGQGDGLVAIDLSDVDLLYDLAMDDEKIVVGGFIYDETTYNDFAVLRLLPDGCLDDTFDDDGWASTNFGATATGDEDYALVVRDGTILLGGVSDSTEFALARYYGRSRLYYTQDANFNVTGLVDASGAVVERYAYTAYGEAEFYDDGWNALSGGSAYDNARLFAGYQIDAETGLFYVRNRYYHANMGRWTSWDPVGYGDGMSMLAYAALSPLVHTDASGLRIIIDHKVEGKPKAGGGLEYDLWFHNTVVNSLQEVIGDCAKLSVRTFYEPRSATPAAQFGVINFTNENPACMCDECWQVLKAAITSTTNLRLRPGTGNPDDEHSTELGKRPHTSWTTDELGRVIPGNPIISVHPDHLPRCGEWIGQVEQAKLKTPPFSIVLWHEIMHGHLNTADEQPVILEENRARACLRKLGHVVGSRYPGKVVTQYQTKVGPKDYPENAIVGAQPFRVRSANRIFHPRSGAVRIRPSQARS